ncbi:MAG: DUF484 family protein [Caulobacteraceae bacterium]|nr:DUF484 family protein [Caulobacteraceae bacterium]
MVSAFLREHPDLIRADADLLTDLGLWLRADNIIEFGPAALARLSADKSRERAARRELEVTARANFAAQAQTHAAVVDLLDSRNHADLARRLDETARLRFGLSIAVIGLELPGNAPAGWLPLPEGGANTLLGAGSLARMGPVGSSKPLFGDLGDSIGSVALVRIALWEPSREGVIAFGSPAAEGFTPQMGTELVSFLARVVERTAERWPVL